MAGRSIGSIEVTVDADTGKLKAQLIKDGRVAGSQAKKAIENELRNVEAELGLNTTRARGQLREFQQAIERVDADIQIGFDEEHLTEELAQIQAEIDQVEADIGVGLDDTDVRGLQLKLKSVTSALDEAIDIRVQLDLPSTGALDQQLKAQIVALEQNKINLEAELETRSITLLEGKLEGLQEKKRDLEFSLELAPKARAILEAQLRRIEVEDRTVEMEVILQGKQALAELKALEENKLRISATFDPTRADAEYESWATRIEAQKLAARIDGDFTDFNLTMRELRAKIALEKFEVNVEADLLGAITTLEEFRAAVGASDTGVPIDADLKKIRAAMVVFREFQEHNDIEVPISADVDALETMLAGMEAQAAAAGGKAGDAFSGGFGSSFSILPSQVTTWIPLITAALEPAAVAVEGLAGGAVQVLSSAFSALAGTAGALLPIMAGLGAVMGSIAIGSLGVVKGFTAVTKEFAAAADEGRAFNIEAEGIQKAMGALGPSAQGVVTAFAELFPTLQKLQDAIAERLFAGLDAQLRILSRETIPDIGNSLVEAAGVANRFFRGLSVAARDVDFSGLFRAITPALDALGRAVINVVRVIEPFLKAATPAAKELAGMFERASEGLLDLVTAGERSGGITQFLDEGLDSLREWGHLVGNVVEALFDLFQSGKKGGDTLVETLSNAVEKFDDWIKSTEGAEAIQSFFTESRRILRDLVPLLEGARDFFAKLITPDSIERAAHLASTLGDLLSTLGEFVNVLAQRLTPLISTLAHFIGTLADAFINLSGPAETVVLALGALALLSGPLSSFASNLRGVFSGIQTSIGLLPTAIGTAALSIKDLFTGLATFDSNKVTAGIRGLGTSIGPILKGVGASAGVIMASSLGVSFGIQMASEADNMAGKVTGAMSVVGSAVTAFFAGGGGITGGVLAGLSLAIGGVISMFQQSAQAAEEARQKVDDFAEAIKDIGPAADKTAAVSSFLDDIEEAGSGVGQTLVDLGFDIDEFVNSLLLGTGDAESAIVHMLDSLGPAGRKAADAIRSGSVSFGNFAAEMGDTARIHGEGMREVTTGLIGMSNAVQTELEKEGIKIGDFNDVMALLGDQADTTEGAMGKLRLRADLTGKTFLTTEGEARALDAVFSDIGIPILGAADAMDTAGESAVDLGDDSDDTEEKLLALGEAAAKLKTDLIKAETELFKASHGFEVLGRRADVLQSIFDLKNAPLDMAGEVRDIKIGIEELSDVAAEVDIGDVLAGNIKGDEVLDALDDLRPEIQTKVVEAFAGGGEQAAIEVADEYIDQVSKELGISHIEAAKLIGLDNVQVTIDQAKLQDELAIARSELETLIGIGGDTPLTASIEFALDKEQLSGDAAQAIQNLVLSGLFHIPLDLLPEVTPEGMEEAKAFIAANPGLLPVGIQFPEELPALPPAAPVEVPVVFNFDQVAADTGLGALVPGTGIPDVIIGANTAEFDAAVQTVSSAIGTLGEATAGPTVTLEGADLALADQVALDTGLAALDNTEATPQVTITDAATPVGQLEGLQTQLDTIDGTAATPSITLENYTQVILQISALIVALSAVDGMSPSVAITLPGIQGQIDKVKELGTEIDSLHDKTVTVTTNNATTGGGMTGRLITHAQTLNVGERGLREVLVPMDLPLNRVSPEVREYAAMLRGGGNVTMAPGKTVNNYMTITPAAADPGAVATQIVNRAAALASR